LYWWFEAKSILPNVITCLYFKIQDWPLQKVDATSYWFAGHTEVLLIIHQQNATPKTLKHSQAFLVCISYLYKLVTQIKLKHIPVQGVVTPVIIIVVTFLFLIKSSQFFSLKK
jgi:hypothetical protein